MTTILLNFPFFLPLKIQFKLNFNSFIGSRRDYSRENVYFQDVIIYNVGHNEYFYTMNHTRLSKLNFRDDLNKISISNSECSLLGKTGKQYQTITIN